MSGESSVVDGEQDSSSHGTRSNLPQALWRKSMAPVKSLKRVNLANAAGQFLVFGAKVAALEAVRKISLARCRPLWWGLQGLFTIQAPPFNWLQRWSPFQQIAHATHVILLELSVVSLFVSSYRITISSIHVFSKCVFVNISRIWILERICCVVAATVGGGNSVAL